MSDKEQFIDAFMEGLTLDRTSPIPKDIHSKVVTLVGIVFDERVKTKQLITRIEQIDSDMADANIQVKCRSCEGYYTLDYDVSEFSSDMSYCGKDPHCCQ